MIESPQSTIYGSHIMEVQRDFRDLLELLNAHKVEYMIVGAYAQFIFSHLLVPMWATLIHTF